jgi:hypothetical protein
MLKVLHGEGLRGPRTTRIELRPGINYFRTFDGSALWRKRSLDCKTWVAVDRSGWREHIWERSTIGCGSSETPTRSRAERL